MNPAKAGPFDLGTVVVRAKIEVNPTTSALTITTDTTGPYKIPTILDGIPLEIKHVNVDIDRPGFTFNPTNCSPLAITGKLDEHRRRHRNAVGAVPGHQLRGARVQAEDHGIHERENLQGRRREPDRQTGLPSRPV